VIREGRITRVEPYDPTGVVPTVEAPSGSDAEPDVLDVGDRVVLPGLVDTHVHINEPGRAEWEGFATAGRAAAAGGVTTLIDMPLNSEPVTASAEALALKRRCADGVSVVDYGFWAGLIPAVRNRLEEVVEAGALGFKAFLVDSGLPEFPPVDRETLEWAMPAIARLGVPLLVHAELPGPIAAARAEIDDALAAKPDACRVYRTWERSRPPAAECDAIDLVAELARATGCRVHIVHVSSAGAVKRVAAAKAAGTRLTAETCPHYLTFTAGDVAEGATEFKCAPPIRGAEDRDALWRALEAGVLDLVATDHSPCPPGLKARDTGDFFEAWGGVSSLGLALSAVWTGASGRGVGLDRVARWLAAAPAHLAGVGDRKGEIAPGRDADLVVFDPDAEVEVTGASLRYRHPLTPYVGRSLRGRVTDTFLGGRRIFGAKVLDAATCDAEAAGRWIR